MALSQTSVLKLYNTVIEDVISGVRESFLDEGVDEQVLQELKQIWETKLMASKAVELNPEPPEPQPPQLSSKNSSSSKGGSKRNSNAQANVQPQIQESSPPRPQPQQPQQPSPPQPTHVQNQQAHLQPQHQPQVPPQQIQQAQAQKVQHIQNMPAQQQMQQHHQPMPQTQQPHVNQQAAPVSTDRQISIQIKLPVHGQLPERLITVHVPASAVQGNQLHALFTGPIISAAIALPTPFATSLLQQHVNSSFEGVPGFTPVQVQPLHVVEQGSNNIMQQQLIQGQAHGNIAQLDGIADDPLDNCDVDVRRENSSSSSSRSSEAQAFTIKIKLPSYNQKAGRVVTLRYPSSTAKDSNEIQMAFPGPATSSALELPSCSTTSFLQLVNSQLAGSIIQLDGATGDSSDDDDEEEEDDNDDDDDPDEDREEEDDENDDAGAREEEPLNSEDDVTDEDPTDLFDTENVVVCQYDKITRSRNKWKFYLKDGIMNLSGKDFVFQKANGDAEW